MVNFFHTKIKGVLQTQEIVKKLNIGDELFFEREPDNQFDSNAIKIITKDKEKVGYIDKDLAKKIVWFIDKLKKKYKINVKDITQVPGKDTKGVNIKVENV